MTVLVSNEHELLNNLDSLINIIKNKISDNTINYIVNSINCMFFNFKQGLRQKYEKDMNELRNESNNRMNNLHNEIFQLRNELRYLMNKERENENVSKKDIIAEVLEVIDTKKHTMEDQSYRDIMEKLMIIYNR